VPVFPPVTVLVDGRPLPTYLSAYVRDGRVFVPVAPIVQRLADRAWYEDATLVVERGDRQIRVRIAPAFVDRLDAAFVAVAPLVRGLGETLSYDASGRLLNVHTGRLAAIALPSPFDSNAPSVAPTTVFTPQPVQTPRPVWSGSPLPRRTPLPNQPPTKFRQSLQQRS
jgi:hypothetical protein